MGAKSWPTLYKVNSNGSIQQWTIHVSERNDGLAEIVKVFGQVDGKLQQSAPDVIQGKNQGKANETSSYEQAIKEAEAQWVKKKTGAKGYVESIEQAKSGEADALVEGGILPMLAQPFKKYGSKITYPAAAQPKLDGIRATIDLNTTSMWTRTRKPIVSMAHLLDEIRGNVIGEPGVFLDGELYNHDYKDKFEEIVSLVRPEYVKEGADVVEMHVFDVAMDGPFSYRYERAKLMVDHLNEVYPKNSHFKLVETIIVNNEDELMEAFNHFREQGYEGAIVRNLDSPYVYKRSYDLQKLKEFDDAEFEIVGVEAGRGKMADKAVFMCAADDGTPEGTVFMVKMKGSLDELRKFVDDPSLAIGKLLTVQYQGLTNGGVPRFPVGISIRDYE